MINESLGSLADNTRRALLPNGPYAQKRIKNIYSYTSAPPPESYYNIVKHAERRFSFVSAGSSIAGPGMQNYIF